MVARALGRYEHGPWGVQFNSEARNVGDTWSASLDLIREVRSDFARDQESENPIYENPEVARAGGAAEYTLVSQKKERARTLMEISYEMWGEIFVSYQSEVLGPDKYKDVIDDRGTIWVDADTGWPVRGTVVRRVETWGPDVRPVHEYTTIIERID